MERKIKVGLRLVQTYFEFKNKQTQDPAIYLENGFMQNVRPSLNSLDYLV